MVGEILQYISGIGWARDPWHDLKGKQSGEKSCWAEPINSWSGLPPSSGFQHSSQQGRADRQWEHGLSTM